MANDAGKSAAAIREEWLKCAASFPYWCHRRVQVYDASRRAWQPFRLWPAQVAAARALQSRRLIVVLKARQLGMSWLVTAYALWLMVFRPAAAVLLFSRRDTEAVHLLAFRLRGMYQRLPREMRAREVLVDNMHELRLSNGSAALAFPTTGGRSYTGTFALVDEADYCDLAVLLDAVKPTIDAGGQLVLLSTVDKRTPGSPFKCIYQAAAAGANGAAGSGWTPIFLPWSARPDRTPEWYAAIKRDIRARSGALDSLYAEYPATDVEALAALSSDARFAAEWLAAADDTRADEITVQHKDTKTQGHEDRRGEASGGEASGIERDSLTDASPLLPSPLRSSYTFVSSCLCVDVRLPSLNGLRVWETPRDGASYVIGADPAEGNPQSDESAACVLDALTGDQAAVWAGRFEPATFAAGLQVISEFYQSAGMLVERNNHGHAVLLALRESGMAAGAAGGSILRGLDGQPGWLTTARSKALAVNAGADLLRDGAAAGRSPRVRDPETLRQLLAFSGARLAAPPGDHDDRCMTWCLAAAAARYCAAGTGESAVIPPAWTIDRQETGGW